MLILGTSAATGICGYLNSQFSGGWLDIYDGTPPASADTAPTAHLLVSIPLPLVAFTSASGSLAQAGQWFATVTTTGIAAWFRLRDAAGTTHIMGSVTGTGGAGPLTLSGLNLLAGSVVQITAFTLTMPLGS